MTKITYIPGEIANAAIDEHGDRKPVTRTQYIFDDAKDKNQAEINAEVDSTFAFHQSEISALNSQNYVTVDSYSGLPEEGSIDTIYRVCNWDGSANDGEGAVDGTVYSQYAWDAANSEYKLLAVRTQIGEVFDISLWNAVGGVLATYDDLADALGVNGANVPAGIRRGGMSVKFVHSVDNNYVQYRLIPDEWSTNVYDWALMEGDVYINNPEFIEVRTDSEKRILWAIKADGSVYWGAGVPQQVIDYVQTKIEELSLDEYGDIVSFLNNLEEGDKTLQQLLDEKVNTETNKSLIQSDVANNVRFSENLEWAEVTLDAEDKVLEGIREDGRKIINLPVVLSEIPENIQKEILPLWGKKLAVTGDSVCAGAGFAGGYAKIIGEKCNMQVQNIAVSGGTVTYGTTSSGGNRFWICDSINDLDADADYILIEGGVNDASLYLPLGSITMDSNHLYDAEVDKETFCGAFEKMCRDLIYRFKGKKYGYIAIHSSAWNYMPARDNDSSFYYAAKTICAKYGVPFCDLTSQIPMFAYLPANDILRTTYTNNGDGWHPNEEGYKKYYIDKIISWMSTL